MNGNTINFGPAIRAHAQSRNVVLSDDDVTALDQTLNSAAEIEAGDQPTLTFGLGGDRRGDLNAALDLFGVGFGTPAGIETGPAKTIPTALTPGAQSATQRAIELNRAAKAGSNEIKQQQATQLATTFGNPWSPDRPNRTNAAFISLHHPELAQQLKRQAGVAAQ